MGSESDHQTPDKTQLPVIHFNSENLSPASSSWAATSRKVRCALESHGCFVAVVHEDEVISWEMHQKMFDAFKGLFDAPPEIKVQNTSEYLGFGYGVNYHPMPLVEYFGITMTNSTNFLQEIREFTDLIWPDGNHNFCETTYSYSRQLLEFRNVVLRMALESYGAEKYYDLLDQSAFHLMRFLKYRTPKEGEINVGLQPHVDKTFFGILGTNHVKGLEFQTKDGEWIAFQPSPSALLIIAGEAFTAWSNGRVYTPVHRVTMGGAEEKYSAGIFSFMHGTLQIPEEFVDEENPLQFKPFNQLAYFDYCNKNGYNEARVKNFCGI